MREEIAGVDNAAVDNDGVIDSEFKLLQPVSYTHLTLPTIYSV